MKITRREDQQGTHRMSMSFSQATYEALRAKSEKQPGYSIAGAARQVIERGVAAGLLYSETPSSEVEDLVKLYQSERLVQLHEELHQEAVGIIKSKGEIIKLLENRLDTKDKQYAQLIQVLENHTKIITDQASSIETLQDALRQLDGPFVVRDVAPDVEEEGDDIPF